MELKIKNVKADLHTHGWCGQETGFGQIVLRVLGETGKRDLATFAQRCFDEEQNTLGAMVNFNDTRYEKITNTRGKIGRDYELYDDHRQRFAGVYDKKTGLWSVMIRGQEIPTDQGHVLIIGGDKNIDDRKIEDVLKQAEDMGALKIADHPLAEYGWLGKIWTRGGRLSLGRNNLEEYKERFDGIEVVNSNFMDLIEETNRIAEELGLPKFCSSDSHTLRNMFSSYMIFPEVDLTSWERLIESIRQRMIKEDYEAYAGTNGRFEKGRHIIAVLYNIAREKIGIVKKPKVTIN
ncbi:hypothetical protein HYW76_04930 [Candidatus Pacearchaeota archaeon]|nr:hypothetical protein [Candidatus Pacearchaeota archaeon]